MSIDKDTIEEEVRKAIEGLLDVLPYIKSNGIARDEARAYWLNLFERYAIARVEALAHRGLGTEATWVSIETNEAPVRRMGHDVVLGFRIGARGDDNDTTFWLTVSPDDVPPLEVLGKDFDLILTRKGGEK